jgi:hypothetical protein
MDSKHIESLLEKYWNCETTLEEEQHLREFFKNEVPESMKDVAEVFRYFHAQQKQQLSIHNFDSVITKKIQQGTPKGKVVQLMSNYARIAAGLLVVVAATYFVRQEVRKAYPPEIADTYSDPKLALEETKKAFLMISNGFNRAQKEASKIKVFHEAEEKIQGKPLEEVKDIKTKI